MADRKTPAVPWQFAGQPETYLMAVRYYINELMTRVTQQHPGEIPPALTVLREMREDSEALEAAHRRGEF